MDKEYIYFLGIKGGVPFYVGRTVDMKDRLAGHKSSSKTGTEAKYQFIRQLEQDGQEWEMVLLAEINSTDDKYEDFWVYLLAQEYTLTNMRAGDSMKQAERDAMETMRGRREVFNDAPSFLAAREREIKEAKARAAADKLNAKMKKTLQVSDPERTLFSFEKPHEKFVSPAMKEMMNRRKK